MTKGPPGVLVNGKPSIEHDASTKDVMEEQNPVIPRNERLHLKP